MSFLLGFYSARAMALLARARDVILPAGSAIPADKPKSRPPETPTGPLLETTVKLSLATSVSTAHPDAVEELNNALDKAEVSFVPKGTSTGIKAERIGEEQEGAYLVKTVAGAYHIIVTAGSSVGINLKGEMDVEVKASGSIELLMVEDTNHG